MCTPPHHRPGRKGPGKLSEGRFRWSGVNRPTSGDAHPLRCFRRSASRVPGETHNMDRCRPG